MSPTTADPNTIVLVADDEAPARRRLTDLLALSPLGTSPSTMRVIEADDGLHAVDVIRTLRPDVVFLDIQMPELDGLGVIDAVGIDEMPLTVFVTAYDHHAIRAFDANALDYLVKPFSDARFDATLARVRARLQERAALSGQAQALTQTQAQSQAQSQTQPASDGRLARLMASERARRPLDRLVVKAGGITRFLPVAEVDWIEAADVYVTLHTAGQEILYRAALSEMAERLDARRFVRIHRSTIVNIDCVAQLEPLSHGEFDVVLKNGTRLRLSRTYKGHLEERLGQPL
jgi:two-component system LytT family response regulator